MPNVNIRFTPMSRRSFNKEAIAAISARIRDIRGDLGQQEFGDLIGVSRVTVSNYETGRRIPSSGVLQKLAEFGKTTVHWITTGQVHDETYIQYYELFKRYIEETKKAGVIPRAWISEDEMAVISVLRYLKNDDRLGIFQKVLNLYREHPDNEEIEVSRTRRLEDIISSREYHTGLDFEEIYESFELVLNRREVDFEE